MPTQTEVFMCRHLQSFYLNPLKLGYDYIMRGSGLMPRLRDFIRFGGALVIGEYQRGEAGCGFAVKHLELSVNHSTK